MIMLRKLYAFQFEIEVIPGIAVNPLSLTSGNINSKNTSIDCAKS